MLFMTIDLSKRINPGKVITVKNVFDYHYCQFNHGFKFRDSVCNACHDLKILCLNISNIAIITVEGVDFRFIIRDIRSS